MDFQHSWNIYRKDWKTSVKRKEVLGVMIFLPVIMGIGMPILMLIGILVDPTGFLESFGDPDLLKILYNIPPHYNDALAAATIMMKMFVLPMFLFIPVLLPVIISSDSFAGEKERKTMESLLYLPITKTELLIGKVLASFLPSMIISLTIFFAMGIVVNIMFIPHLAGNLLLFGDPTAMLIGLLMSPSWALLNIQIGVIISSRARDLKSAQSIGGALITPVLGIFFIAIFSPTFLNIITVLIISGGLLILWIIFVYIGNRVLDPEKLIVLA